MTKSVREKGSEGGASRANEMKLGKETFCDEETTPSPAFTTSDLQHAVVTIECFCKAVLRGSGSPCSEKGRQ